MNVIPFTLREYLDKVFHPITLIAWFFGAWVAAYTRAFGIDAYFGPVGVYVYWYGILLMSLFFGALVDLSIAPVKGRWANIALILKGALIFSFSYGLALQLVNMLVLPPRTSYVREYWGLFGFLFPIYIAVASARMLIRRQPEVDMAEHPFRARLSKELGIELIRVGVKDHYVEVHTKLGSELVLMRFSDAIAELSNCGGMQVHRSHWIATKEVLFVERKQGRISLQMSDGSEVPVSRKYQCSVEEADWPMQTGLNMASTAASG